MIVSHWNKTMGKAQCEDGYPQPLTRGAHQPLVAEMWYGTH